MIVSKSTDLNIDSSSSSKLRAAKKLWRQFNPECSLSGGRITCDSLRFEVSHALGVGVAASWSVRISKVDDQICSLQVRMGLYDERVNALRTIAMGRDTSVDCEVPIVTSLTDTQPDFLDFDLLTVSSMINREEKGDYPLLKDNVQIEQLAHVFEECSIKIERMWNFFGGPSVQSVERLAIWLLRNSDVGSMWHMLLRGICGAFAYGEKELAHELIALLMSEWDEFCRLAPTDRVWNVYEHVRGQVERLQEAVGRPN